jgi:DNA processing protein
VDPHQEDEELVGWLRLTHSRGVGRETARKLLAAFGLPPAIFDADDFALRQLVSAPQLQALRTLPDDFDGICKRTREWLQARDETGAGRWLITLGDPRYPRSLLEIEDPPIALYMMGRLAFHHGSGQGSPCIAIVGTRNPTPQGAENAHAFAAHFAEAGYCVVSGLALGIDAAAHEGALTSAARRNDNEPDAGSDETRNGLLATIAVVGTGLDQVYPRRNRALAQRIAAGGLTMSEYPLGTPPLAANFPRRNRLISGLALGTLVVEATQPSGSLITARMALEQGREVFAIPGSIHSPQSRGCHALIRQGAKLVECAQDVLEELPQRLDVNATGNVAGTAVHGSSTLTEHIQKRQRQLYEPDPSRIEPERPSAYGPPSVGAALLPLLSALGFDPVGLDALVARTGIDTARLQGQLLELELDGHVRRLTGGLFQRIASA